VAANQAGPARIESIPAATLLVLPKTGSYEQHGEAIAQITRYAMKRNLMRGGPFAVYYSNPEEVAEDSLRWEICIPVPEGTEPEPPFAIRQTPEMKAAVLVCTGPYEGTAPCYGVLSVWIAENGHAIAGPVEEHWMSDPQTMPAEKLQARIVFPVR
jgi:effector-binding domain-containing protein